jgi:hyperosmotically inducible periplasmic protein
MKSLKSCLWLTAVVVLGTMAACSTTATKSADVSASVRTALDQAGYKDVSSSQDRDKGVVTLSGHVATDGDKAQAESIVKSIAGTQVVANEIAVVPPDAASDAKKVNSELDEGIESNLKAALIQNKLDASVKYSVKNHVVTLTGEVNSQATRTRAQKVAAGVLNVQQVVNELQVKGQKASSTD